MNNYNLRLSELRENAGLSLKEASKALKISKWKIYLYENGYFRPTKKDLKKFKDFYKEEISLEGDDAYPAPTKEKVLKKEKEALKVKRIVFGSLSGAILLAIIAGTILFNQSVNNTKSYYGETYNETRDKVNELGEIGYDIATSLKYHMVSEHESGEATFIFFETDNILYFNECSYSTTILNEEWGLDRLHYQFGFNLGVSSYRCDFQYGSVNNGEYFSCSFDYTGGKTDSIYNFKHIVQDGADPIDESKALELVNSQIDAMSVSFSGLLSHLLEKDADFYKDFLPAREQGRKINFSLQISGLLLIIPGIIAFYIIFGLFIRYLTKNFRPRLVETNPEKINKNLEPLPKDININFGIPDVIIVLIGKILQYGSILLLIVAFLAKLGIPFLSFFANPNLDLLTFFRFSLLGGIFLEHFVMIGRIKKPTILFEQIIFNLGVFLFVATIETVLIVLTDAWGYDFANLIYKYIPGNVYQIVAVHYLIFLFLFFQPPFLNKKGFKVRFLWHSLSFIPLGFLIATYFLSNSYALVYGVEENVFINFWFPNGFLSLSVVCVFLLYVTFFIRLFYERRYGKHNAQTFFYGDRYTIIENAICAALIIIVTSIDFVFAHNQYAHYLGLGGNVWMYALVPFIILCKYSPNNQQVFLIDEQLRTFAGRRKV